MTNVMHQYLLSSFDERWMNFSMRLSVAKKDASMENVHHFRVATRRLLVLIDLLNNILPQSKYDKLRKYLRGLRSNFNDLHDTQMVIDSLMIAREKDLEVNAYLKLMEKTENHLHKEAVKVISNLIPGHLFNISIQIRTELVAILAEPNFINEQILPKLDDSYAEIKKISKFVEPENVTTIHALRISYRKFRYMIEILIPILHDYPVEYLALMRTYQDMMGDIQNGEIILNHLNKLAKKVPKFKRLPVLAFFKTNYEASIATFLQHFVDTPNFWRDSNLGNMPWHLLSEGSEENGIRSPISDMLLSETESTSINPDASLSDLEDATINSDPSPSGSESTDLPENAKE
jgi:CHAD domain-containing protein